MIELFIRHWMIQILRYLSEDYKWKFCRDMYGAIPYPYALCMEMHKKGLVEYSEETAPFKARITNKGILYLCIRT